MGNLFILELAYEFIKACLYAIGQFLIKFGKIVLFIIALIMLRAGFFAGLKQWAMLPTGTQRLVGLTVLGLLLVNHFDPEAKCKVRDWMMQAIRNARENTWPAVLRTIQAGADKLAPVIAVPVAMAAIGVIAVVAVALVRLF